MRTGSSSVRLVIPVDSTVDLAYPLRVANSSALVAGSYAGATRVTFSAAFLHMSMYRLCFEASAAVACLISASTFLASTSKSSCRCARRSLKRASFLATVSLTAVATARRMVVASRSSSMKVAHASLSSGTGSTDTPPCRLMAAARESSNSSIPRTYDCSSRCHRSRNCWACFEHSAPLVMRAEVSSKAEENLASDSSIDG
mmetsp:Transcript_24189/g.63156  ORF Transcript_24189/g.63156 Transcript_24189/m.63156 type:complete len:201 (+) Transcript_24189:386-988(+)